MSEIIHKYENPFRFELSLPAYDYKEIKFVPIVIKVNAVSVRKHFEQCSQKKKTKSDVVMCKYSRVKMMMKIISEM